MGPDCHNHGNLVGHLALGRLDDLEAVRAEEVRANCSTCSRWWLENFDSQTATAVEFEVSAAFQAFRAPRRQRRYRVWWAAAAAAILSIGLLNHLWISAPVDSGIVISDVASEPAITGSPSETIKVMDFETGSVASAALLDKPDEPVFAADFEAGLGTWKTSS